MLPSRRSPLLLAGAALAGLVAASLPATGQEPLSGAAPFAEYGIQGEGEARVQDADRRAGAVQPSSAQRTAAAALGADDPRWNRFGTPHVLFDRTGDLSGPRRGAAADVARAFVRDNAALFRLSAADVAGLELLRDSPLYDAPDLGRVYREGGPAANPRVAHSVLFRQRFDGLQAGLDGLLTVGVQADGRVTWVSSSVTGDDGLSGTRRLDAAAAVRAAASDVGMDLGELTETDADGAFTVLRAAGTADVQRARLVAVPTPTQGVRRAYEVTLLDSALDEHGNPTAFISFVDAETGEVLQRSNRVEHLADEDVDTAQRAPSGGPFTGTTRAGACGTDHVFQVSEGNGTIGVGVNARGDFDITINLFFGKGDRPVASQDLLGSPEALVYSPAGGVPAGTYRVQVCPFSPAGAPATAYDGLFAATPGGNPGDENGTVKLPTWRVFPANPPLTSDANTKDDSNDTRVLWCWDADTADDCAEQQRNAASRLPWDVNAPSLPSFTTDGNNASTAISEASFLTPDTLANRPFSPTRDYDYPWENSWNESSCNPTNFGTVADDRNDEAASTTNLFVQHNLIRTGEYALCA